VAAQDASASQSRKSSGVEATGAISNSPEAPAAPAPIGTPTQIMRAPAIKTAPREGALLANPRQADQAGPFQQEMAAQRARLSASPDDWLRRIIELRRAGKNAQADDELARFRAAFPNVRVPDDAMKQ
jgi:hypothetical protein